MAGLRRLANQEIRRNNGARFAGLDFKRTTRFSGARPHASQTDAGSAPFEHVPLFFLRNAAALIFHLEPQMIAFLMEANGSGGAAGVAVDVGEAFLHDA